MWCNDWKCIYVAITSRYDSTEYSEYQLLSFPSCCNESYNTINTYVVVAYVVVAYKVMTYVVTDYMIMTYIVITNVASVVLIFMARMRMACIVVAYKVMPCVVIRCCPGIHSYGPWGVGLYSFRLLMHLRPVCLLRILLWPVESWPVQLWHIDMPFVSQNPAEQPIRTRLDSTEVLKETSWQCLVRPIYTYCLFWQLWCIQMWPI